MPAAYDWLGQSTPTDTYDYLIVRGKTVKQVLRNLGDVQKKLGERTPSEAEEAFFDHFDTWPSVAQVQKLGPAVFVYVPYDFRALERIHKLSTKGVAADFVTTVELDTYVTVAKRGKQIRQFDAGFDPPEKGALPEEKGLDFGAKKQNVFATAWAFIERLTRIHVSRDWFEGDHPTYVLKPLD
jgi:hypothetical protein